MGLPKANRLKRRQDFRVVYQQGIRRQTPYLIVQALVLTDGEQQLPAKFGIVISQKVSKKATVRNRIKRQIRGAIRELLPEILPGWKIVIVVRPEALQCKYEHFLRQLKQLLIKLEVIDGHQRDGLL